MKPGPVTVEQASAWLWCHPRTVRQLLESGRLAGVRAGNSWTLDSSAFHRFRASETASDPAWLSPNAALQISKPRDDGLCACGWGPGRCRSAGYRESCRGSCPGCFEGPVHAHCGVCGCWVDSFTPWSGLLCAMCGLDAADIPSRGLRPHHVPKPGAPWFDVARFAKSGESLRDAAADGSDYPWISSDEKAWIAPLDTLRLALWSQARRYHAYGDGPGDQRPRFDRLLDDIRRRVREQRGWVAHVRTHIDIDAPAVDVWEAILDFPKYQEWNPFQVRIIGQPRTGREIAIQVVMPSGRRMTLIETVRSVDHRNYAIHWGGGPLIPKLADGQHFFRVFDLGGGRTRLVQGEDFSGLLVRFLRPMIANVERGFHLANAALKHRVESAQL